MPSFLLASNENILVHNEPTIWHPRSRATFTVKEPFKGKVIDTKTTLNAVRTTISSMLRY